MSVTYDRSRYAQYSPEAQGFIAAARMSRELATAFYFGDETATPSPRALPCPFCGGEAFAPAHCPNCGAPKAGR